MDRKWNGPVQVGLQDKQHQNAIFFLSFLIFRMMVLLVSNIRKLTIKAFCLPLLITHVSSGSSIKQNSIGYF